MSITRSLARELQDLMDHECVRLLLEFEVFCALHSEPWEEMDEKTREEAASIASRFNRFAGADASSPTLH